MVENRPLNSFFFYKSDSPVELSLWRAKAYALHLAKALSLTDEPALACALFHALGSHFSKVAQADVVIPAPVSADSVHYLVQQVPLTSPKEGMFVEACCSIDWSSPEIAEALETLLSLSPSSLFLSEEKTGGRRV